MHIYRAVVAARDIRHCHGLRLTSPPRTILDLSRLLDEGELEWLVAEAAYRKLASEKELKAQVEGNRRKKGVARLRRVLDLPGGPQRTRSRGERAMLRLLRRARITGFETNAWVHSYEVDFFWREAQLAVELDGWDGHSARVAFERDRLKMATLGAHGVAVMPITGRQIRDDPDGVIRRLEGAIASRCEVAVN
jgi:very-short-patch-repair endonuclease